MVKTNYLNHEKIHTTIMINLDKKDRMILYQLDINSRQSSNQIGKKVGLPRSVVAYRISKLKKEGIIKNFFTLIDSMCLGLIPIRIHIKFKNTTSQKIMEIVDFFVNNKYSTLVCLTYGFFDLSVVIEVREMHDFYDTWLNAKKRYGYYFQNHSLSLFINEMKFNQSYLLLNDAKKSDRENYLFIGKRNIDQIDDIDIGILKIVATNAEVSLVDISKEFNMSSVAIKHRLMNLIKKNIILGYKVDIDYSRIGFQKLKSYIKLNDFNKRTYIKNYIKYNHHLINIDENSGESDIELEFILKHVGDLRDIMNDLSDRFPNVIKNYDIVSTIRLKKYVYFPEYF